MIEFDLIWHFGHFSPFGHPLTTFDPLMRQRDNEVRCPNDHHRAYMITISKIPGTCIVPVTSACQMPRWGSVPWGSGHHNRGPCGRVRVRVRVSDRTHRGLCTHMEHHDPGMDHGGDRRNVPWSSLKETWSWQWVPGVESRITLNLQP